MGIPERFVSAPCTISAGSSACEAAKEMRSLGIGSLIVVDAENKPTGLVTDRDLALGVLCKGLAPEEALVGELMCSPLISAPAGASVLACTRLMRRHLVRRLPIVDGAGELIGLVSADDLLGCIAEELRSLAQATSAGFAHEAHPPEGPISILGKE